MCIMDPVAEIHFYGWWALVYIQKQFSNYSEWMLFLSKLGDPRYAFLIYFPVAFCLSRSRGTQVLWVACSAEWLNAVLKLILHGDRPYWWVGETYKYKEKAELETMLPTQYNLTCETGPGSPSGHAMVTSAVFFVLVKGILDSRQKHQRIMQAALWTSFAAIILAVDISRVFIATHFPHQVIMGTLIGIGIGAIINMDVVASLRSKHYLLGTMVAVGGCMLTYYALLSLGYDPLWSIPMAHKWCATSTWVHPDTSLFFAVIRDISCLAGFGFSVYIFEKKSSEEKPGSVHIMSKILQIVSSLCVTLMSENIKLPRDSDAIFYGAAFIKFFLMVLVLVVQIPAVFDRCASKSNCTKKKNS
ncbi:glucose-6-phosphatase 3-like isoform X2 [Mizuhopecten yessoensis]|uniref:glucose-6-phosphatase n=1 Tax=Mizuhopecten yessoensis TaxID=6573 RepID=A0A210QZ82_MIZYE|nr:glucose-6-phosphatase 3-like isoform X2 [Mizuhopecten yessoensis]OWF54078.1 Glucose-6-phosphatase 2 [Mizuhopecten yessoensis]